MGRASREGCPRRERETKALSSNTLHTKPHKPEGRTSQARVGDFGEITLSEKCNKHLNLKEAIDWRRQHDPAAKQRDARALTTPTISARCTMNSSAVPAPNARNRVARPNPTSSDTAAVTSVGRSNCWTKDTKVRQ